MQHVLSRIVGKGIRTERGMEDIYLSHFNSFSDAAFIQTTDFLWKVVVITLVSCLPLYVLKILRKKFSPPSYSKLT